jgi:cleavage and polyadenylation specificity factor subunit 3
MPDGFSLHFLYVLQELLLILDEYWQANPHLHNIPIWYASKLASRALRVYQTYSNMMNARIRAQMDVSNPFSFTFIQNLKSINVNSFDDSGPSVVFASPGMLQSGVSRQLFDRWASDPKNGVMIAGYAVEHTLAKEIMAQPKEVVTLEGRKQPLNCLVVRLKTARCHSIPQIAHESVHSFFVMMDRTTSRFRLTLTLFKIGVS